MKIIKISCILDKKIYTYPTITMVDEFYSIKIYNILPDKVSLKSNMGFRSYPAFSV